MRCSVFSMLTFVINFFVGCYSVFQHNRSVRTIGIRYTHTQIQTKWIENKESLVYYDLAHCSSFSFQCDIYTYMYSKTCITATNSAHLPQNRANKRRENENSDSTSEAKHTYFLAMKCVYKLKFTAHAKH